MTQHAFITADVFTDRPFGGNPLAGGRLVAARAGGTTVLMTRDSFELPDGA